MRLLEEIRPNSKLLRDVLSDELSVMELKIGNTNDIELYIVPLGGLLISKLSAVNKAFIEFILYLIYIEEIPEDVYELFELYIYDNNMSKMLSKYTIIDLIETFYTTTYTLLKNSSSKTSFIYVGWLNHGNITETFDAVFIGKNKGDY